MHAQVPLTQVDPDGHALSQRPQWVLSLARVTQAPLHTVSMLLQESLQRPSLHTWFEAQVVPQAPQCWGLLRGLTHRSPHSVVPAAQRQRRAVVSH